MSSPNTIVYRTATSADVPAMLGCRMGDTAAGPGDSRMAAYFDGQHHPQQALAPRGGYLAMAGDGVVGYIAGHLTRRHGCDAEIQYLYVAPKYRRQGVAMRLLHLLSRWFIEQRARKVCVNANLESPGAAPFYLKHGATALSKYWYVWDDIGVVLDIPPVANRDWPSA